MASDLRRRRYGPDDYARERAWKMQSVPPRSICEESKVLPKLPPRQEQMYADQSSSRILSFNAIRALLLAAAPFAVESAPQSLSV